MALLGKALRRLRAGAQRGPFSGSGFDAPESITVTSSAFADGAAMPQSSAGKGVGANTSPALRWAGLPPETEQVVLIIDDVDVPLPRPLLHTIAVIDPTLDRVAAGAMQPGTSGMRFIRADLGHRGYACRGRPTPDPRPRAAPLPISRVRARPGHSRWRHHGQGAAGRHGRSRVGPGRTDRHLRAMMTTQNDVRSLVQLTRRVAPH
jgi:Phosphatidylethanolamine-binding protein